MLISTVLIAAVVVFAVGTIIIWANPHRAVNRVVFTCSIHISAWLVCFHFTPTGVIWLKVVCAVGGAIPLHFWLVKQCIVSEGRLFRSKLLRDAAPLIAVTLFLTIIPFTDAFIPPESTAERRLFGWGYYAYIAIDLLLYCWVFATAYLSMRTLTGARRLELQVWLFGACGTAIVIVARMALRALFKDPAYNNNIPPLAVLFFYAGAAYAITMHRIFDARQILRFVIESALVVVFVTICGYFVFRGASLLFPGPISLLATTAVALWLALLMRKWVNRAFHFYEASSARQEMFETTRREMRLDALETRCLEVLRGWGKTEHAMLAFGNKEGLRGQGVEIAGDSLLLQGMRTLRWATPERLARERATRARAAVASFLKEQRLGALVFGEGPSLTILVGVGVSVSRRPFTFPQITELQELASIVESALERAHFSVKAQHAEQLATVGLLGASLAHEIRNPLVTIKTFVQLLPKHHHDPVFRQKFFGLIGDEVTRIDRLTEQLLDLASPRVYKAEPIELHPVLRTSLELVAAKATDKRIEFLTDFQAKPDRALTDASAAKQVLLNLCFNAIQAVETQTEGARWVKVATRNVPQGVEMTVEDSGPGISPAIRPRLFQPFQSTKSSGFGLGLAICSDILAGLDATISVDPTVPGRGALFRIVFPCPAS